MFPYQVCIAIVFVCAVECSIKTIGTARAGVGVFAEIELTLFEHEVEPGNRGMMTYFWFTGDFAPWDKTFFKFYIDDIEQSLDIPAYLGLTLPEKDTEFMYGSELTGKGAKRGGVYNTIRIPFQKRIKITFFSSSLGQIFFICRGFEGNDESIPKMVSVNLGGAIDLPPSAMLNVAVIRNQTVDLFEKVTLFNSEKKTAIFLTVLQVDIDMDDATYLEGCFRAYLPDGSMQYLSSGTEDYFQSANYFDGGAFQYPESGIVYWKTADATMYRFHNRDAIVFDQGVKYVWRNCETISLKTGMKCSDEDEQIKPIMKNILPVKMSSVVWYYTW